LVVALLRGAGPLSETTVKTHEWVPYTEAMKDGSRTYLPAAGPTVWLFVQEWYRKMRGQS